MITDDGIPVADAHLQRRACEYARELGLVVQTHSEDPSLRQGGVMHEGARVARARPAGQPGRGRVGHDLPRLRDRPHDGRRVHIAHVSSERGMRVSSGSRRRARR
jgi:dihydroorotase